MSLNEIQKQKNIEISIRMCLVDGKSIPEIANATNLSTSTVQGYLSDRYIIDRYGIRTAQAIKDKIAKDQYMAKPLDTNYDLNNESTNNELDKLNISVKKR